jgi:hypothetical protein
MGRAALTLTSIVPHLLIYGCAIYTTGRAAAVPTLTSGVLLLLIAWLLLIHVRRNSQRQVLPLQRSENIDRDGFAFLLTYALPLLVAKDPHLTPGILVFVAIVLLFLVRSDMLWVNPLLVILGFHAVKVIAASDNTYLLLSNRQRVAGKRDVTAIRLTENVWLEV